MGITNTAAVSNEILPIYAVEAILQAQANFVFRRFVDYKFQASRQAGDTMRFWKRSNIGGGGALGEAEPVPTQSLSSTTVDVVMTEYGNSVALTRKAAETDIFDLIFHASLQLGRNYSLILDSAIRDTYLATANEQYAGGAASEATIGYAGVLNTTEIKDAVETLKTLNVPPVTIRGREEYISIIHPHQARTIKDDPRWINAANYGAPLQLFTGELGRFENVTFIETTQMPVVTGVNSLPTYHGLIFGDRAVAMGERVPFELIADQPQDLGRSQRLGWYSIMGFKILNDYIVELVTV